MLDEPGFVTALRTVISPPDLGRNDVHFDYRTTMLLLLLFTAFSLHRRQDTVSGAATEPSWATMNSA